MNLKDYRVDETYYDFEFKASQILTYTVLFQTVVIALRKGRIVYYTPEDMNYFRLWLRAHHIYEINNHVRSRSLHPSALRTRICALTERYDLPGIFSDNDCSCLN